MALPRNRIAGAPIGVVCLIWSAWHGCLMLEGPLASLHPIVWLLVPIVSILAFFFLDYLFSRSLGGFFVLMSNELIRQAFAHSTTMRPLYSLVCLLLGVAGLFLIGTPWRLRDTLELAAKEKKAALSISGALFFCSAILILLPLI